MAALNIKPIDMGCNKDNDFKAPFHEKKLTINAKLVMITTAGSIQTSNVNRANPTPPLLKPTKTMVCVEDAPGRS